MSMENRTIAAALLANFESRVFPRAEQLVKSIDEKHKNDESVSDEEVGELKGLGKAIFFVDMTYGLSLRSKYEWVNKMYEYVEV